MLTDLCLVANGSEFAWQGATYRAEQVCRSFAICTLLTGRHQGATPGNTVFVATYETRVQVLTPRAEGCQP